ncbi:MAG: transposase [Mesorhizobium sp.]|nr:MAG: hypothetical protein EOR42_30335 [Mesorhizobium sp.]TIN06134.1 MAG: transposase [Mesorhizobium sp.]
MNASLELSDFEWSVIQPHLPNKVRGLARVDGRKVLNSILWRFPIRSLRADVPDRYRPVRHATVSGLAQADIVTKKIRQLTAATRARNFLSLSAVLSLASAAAGTCGTPPPSSTGRPPELLDRHGEIIDRQVVASFQRIGSRPAARILFEGVDVGQNLRAGASAARPACSSAPTRASSYQGLPGAKELVEVALPTNTALERDGLGQVLQPAVAFLRLDPGTRVRLICRLGGSVPLNFVRVENFAAVRPRGAPVRVTARLECISTPHKVSMLGGPVL